MSFPFRRLRTSLLIDNHFQLLVDMVFIPAIIEFAAN